MQCPWIFLKTWDFSETPKQIYRKLQHWKKLFAKFQSQPHFPRKNGFVFVDQIQHYKDLNKYSMAQKIWFTLFQSKFIGNSKIWRKFSGSFNVCFVFTEKLFCICQTNFLSLLPVFLSLLPEFNHTEHLI